MASVDNDDGDDNDNDDYDNDPSTISRLTGCPLLHGRRVNDRH